MINHLEYWHTSAAVFADEGSSQHLFLTSAMQDSLQRITAYLEKSPTLIAIVGAEGQGKTSFAKALYRTLNTQKHEILLISLFATEQKSGWLIQRLIKTLTGQSIPTNGDLASTLDLLGPSLDELAQDGRRFTIIVDNAHKAATTEALNEIHALIDLQSAVSPCLNFVLLGSDRLKDGILAHPGLKNRLTYQGKLAPLTRQECMEYVKTRLRTAQLSESIFTPEALETLYQMSGGVFSLINIIGENSLIEAALKKVTAIDASIVLSAGRHLDGSIATDSPAPQSTPIPSNKTDLVSTPLKMDRKVESEMTQNDAATLPSEMTEDSETKLDQVSGEVEIGGKSAKKIKTKPKPARNPLSTLFVKRS